MWILVHVHPKHKNLTAVANTIKQEVLPVHTFIKQLDTYYRVVTCKILEPPTQQMCYMYDTN